MFDIKLVSNRMFIKHIVGKSIVTVLLDYALQVGLDNSV